jgi:GTP-binding protein
VIPVIALVGRPNVGKSTLFNRLTRSRDALVADIPGLTRDRQYGEFKAGDTRFILIDTGGISGIEEGIDSEMARQSLMALAECDLALLLVDGRAGLTPTDRDVVDRLRASGKTFRVIVNKIDGIDEHQASAEFHSIGAAALHAVSASQGRGVGQLLEALEAAFRVEAPVEPDAEEADQSEETAEGAEEGAADGAEADGSVAHSQRARVAVVGRPNVGKSTLVNRILGEERVVVYDQPGTTRDSIYIDFERRDKHYTLIDTAGIRRKRSVHEVIEKFSIVKTLQAIADAEVVLLLLDAHDGLVEQDVHLLGHVIEAGRSLVIVCNKWDGLPPEQKGALKADLERRLVFAEFAEVHYISALHGSNVGDLYGAVDRAWASSRRKLPTNRLTTILEEAVAAHSPPLVNGRRIKLRYAHPGGSNPPVIVIHGNQTESVPDHYKRYLENVFRKQLKLVGTPLRVQFVTGENPYKGKRNTLTPRQLYKRKRLMSHVKKGR